MVSQYAFVVNSDACSGCKTCQVACKDKNDLPIGLHWRKVYEVTSGDWRRQGDAWEATVAAYNLSTTCHHCLNPVCIPCCQADAIFKTETGIVLIDENRCRNCHACELACPYGAIRFNPVRNTTTKCDFCADLLDLGRPPTCVAGCPTRLRRSRRVAAPSPGGRGPGVPPAARRGYASGGRHPPTSERGGRTGARARGGQSRRTLTGATASIRRLDDVPRSRQRAA
jgi:anaerobic dimethyl sulfoxide reductase subunit B (iron-sulfur subunit)